MHAALRIAGTEFVGGDPVIAEIKEMEMHMDW